MVHPLIGIHAALGEIGVMAFLWVFIELLNPTEKRIKRARIVAIVGLIFILISWLTGGFYYVKYYGPDIKPLIKEGPAPWAHSIVMEVKEHVFLFIPLLALLASAIISKYGNEMMRKKELRNAALILSALIVVMGFAMATMGYLISTGARFALEAAVS